MHYVCVCVCVCVCVVEREIERERMLLCVHACFYANVMCIEVVRGGQGGFDVCVMHVFV